MSEYRLDLSVRETEQLTGDDGVVVEHPTEARSLVLVYTDDETVMAAALRAYADILDPKDPAAVRKQAARATRPGSRRGAAARDEDDFE